MIAWARFIFIIAIIAIDDILRELASSFKTTLYFFRYRVRWIMQDKARTLLKK